MKKNLLCATLAAGIYAAAPAAEQPNVIVIVTDDQGYGDLSCHGNPVLQTPAMDRLHDQSVRLTDFHVDPTCAPTRAALMTGQYAHRVRVWHTIAGGNSMRETETTLADIFKANGYRTGCFGKWHLGSSYPFRPIDRGFDEWWGQGDGGTGTTADWFDNDRVDDMYIHNGTWVRQKGWGPDVFFLKAMEFMKNSEKPFFAYLATYVPHSPHTLPDPSWTDKYSGKVSPIEASFFAGIEGVDRCLARLDTFLQTEGLTDNTILIFMTDNGSAAGWRFYNAGMRNGKGSVYDGGHRVPFFIRWPDGQLAHGQDMDALTAHIDVLPTLIDLCGLKAPVGSDFDGQNFKELLYAPKTEMADRSLVVEKQRTLKPEKHKNFAVLTRRWRLVQEKESPVQLFDMDSDPGQQTDVADQHPDIVQSLKADYETYWTHVSPNDRETARPVIGTPHETETLLHASDLHVSQVPWNHAKVAEGMKAVGPYAVRIAESGTYRIEVRRWPREADAAMAGVPNLGTKTTDAWLHGNPVDGVIYGGGMTALPVQSVRLNVGGFSEIKPVAISDKCVVFTSDLKAGDYNLQADLLGKKDEVLTSAYYIYVRRVQSF